MEDQLRGMQRRLRKMQPARLRKRMKTMQPTGWAEFVKVVNVLKRARAVGDQLETLLPLGQTAAAIRGLNELWLALAFTEPCLASLTPVQLAAVCSGLVAEGIKGPKTDKRGGRNGGGGGGGATLYSASDAVMECFEALEPVQFQLLDLQEIEGVDIPCVLDSQFAGLVEAWASGVKWSDLVGPDGCQMDDGDVARLFRRTIDALCQIPHLPNVDRAIVRAARQAAALMDRPPISELVG
eukprot:TRINITY_DN8532_c0_g2_i1.p1 TRINITY_DN8532_c0_g2~~TRINITY_DN8532_c0_g2_i1.p1  ORF type:complete len:247 (-),score=45.86 TRINITY_DN8532_c0_g2_i1:704-1420(-)